MGRLAESCRAETTCSKDPWPASSYAVSRRRAAHLPEAIGATAGPGSNPPGDLLSGGWYRGGSTAGALPSSGGGAALRARSARPGVGAAARQRERPLQLVESPDRLGRRAGIGRGCGADRAPENFRLRDPPPARHSFEGRNRLRVERVGRADGHSGHDMHMLCAYFPEPQVHERWFGRAFETPGTGCRSFARRLECCQAAAAVVQFRSSPEIRAATWRW